MKRSGIPVRCSEVVARHVPLLENLLKLDMVLCA